MKHKKITYLLLPLVAVIWGIIFYRIFSAVSPEPILPVGGSILTSKTINTSIPDTFSIIANYRDPFLGKVVQVKDSASGKVKPPKTEKVVIPKQWPSLSYGGIIKNQKSGKQFVLVNINGEGNLMKTGDEVSGIQLLKVYKDSIEVSFQKEKKVVWK